MHTGIIYLITNKVNGKRYVGKTLRTAETRWKEHKDAAFKQNSAFPLHAAFRKYGLDAFCFTVLRQDIPEPRLSRLEGRLISSLRTHVKHRTGYNKTAGGELCVWFGQKHTPEAKKKMAGRTGSKNAFFGQQHTEETKELMRKPKPGLRGKAKSEEHKHRIKAANLGKQKTEEHKANLKAAAAKRWARYYAAKAATQQAA